MHALVTGITGLALSSTLATIVETGKQDLKERVTYASSTSAGGGGDRRDSSSGLEMYRELLEMALADGVLDEYEEERLVDARRRYAITDAQHQTLLMEAKAGLKHGTAGGDYLDLEIPSGRIIPGDGGQKDGGGGEGHQSSSKSAAPRPRRRASTNAEIPAGTAVRELHALFGETVNVIAQLEAALKVPLTIADALGGRQIHSLLLASCFLLLASCFLLLASCFLLVPRHPFRIWRVFVYRLTILHHLIFFFFHRLTCPAPCTLRSSLSGARSSVPS
jgi:hypothetical protein